jgi:outer membrane protein
MRALVHAARPAAVAALLALALWPTLVLPQTLSSLYRDALGSHPALRAQDRIVDRAVARQDQAVSRLRPQASLNANVAHNDFRSEGSPRSEYDSRRHVLQVRQALLDIPSARQRDAEALRVEQSRRERDAVRMETAHDVVDRYLEVLTANAELGSLRAERDAVDGQLARLRRLYERQLAKVTDVLEAEAYRVTLRAREVEALNAKAVALERLRETTGTVVTDVPALGEAAPLQAVGTMNEWVRRALDANPRLQALQFAFDAEDRAVAAARGQHLPLIALTASKTWSNTDSDSRRNPPYNVAAIGVQLTLALYEGGRVGAATDEAVARREIVREQREEKRREIEREVRTAFLKQQADVARIEAAAQTRRAYERSREAQQKGFELGAVTIVDLLDAQKRLFRAIADHAKARHEFVRSSTTLRLQGGVLDDQRIDDLSGWMERPRAAPTSGG